MVDTNKLKAKIVEAGLSQRKLAPMLGMSKNTLWKKINNLAVFDLKEVIVLCRILGISTPEEKCSIFLLDSSQ